MCRQISINLCESDSVYIQCKFLSGKTAQCYENIQDKMSNMIALYLKHMWKI